MERMSAESKLLHDWGDCTSFFKVTVSWWRRREGRGWRRGRVGLSGAGGTRSVVAGPIDQDSTVRRSPASGSARRSRRLSNLLVEGKVAVGHPLRGKTLARPGPGRFTHRGPT